MSLPKMCSALLVIVLTFCLHAAAAERGEEPYLIVPKDYTPEKSWPLILVGQNQIAASQMADKPYFAAYIGPGTGAKRLILELAKKYNLDPFRVYVTAFSRTGHGALESAYTLPGWWAAIAPVDEDMRFKAGRTQQKIDFLQYIRTPTLMLHGRHDSFRKTGWKNYESMKAAGCPVWWEWFDGGHNPDPIFRKNVKILTDFFEKHKVEPYPKDVVHVVVRSSATRAWWVDCTVLEAATKKPTPPVYRVRVRENNRIDVEADEGILGLKLMLNEKLVDMGRPVTVTWAGKPLYAGPAKAVIDLPLREGTPAKRPPVKALRPLWEDLEEMRSQPNPTGARDWVYLELNTGFHDPRLKRAVKRRICLDLGLRLADGPKTAKITPASKHFLPMDLTAETAAATFDMADMQRKLPVQVTVAAKGYALAGEDPVRMVAASEGRIGQLLVVKVALVNRGERPIVGDVTLNRSPFMMYPRGMWPKGEDRGDFVKGLYEIAATRRFSSQWAPRLGSFPYHCIGWLSVNPDGRLAAATPVESGMWRSIWAVRRKLSLAPGLTVTLPLLLISVPAPDLTSRDPKMPDLGKIIDQLKPSLVRTLGD